MYIRQCIFLCFFFTATICAKDVNVLYAPPGAVLSGYWKATTLPMTSAAKQFNINLTINSIPNSNGTPYEKNLLKLIDTLENIDWLIWSQRRTATKKVLDTLEKRKIKSIDITSGAFLRHRPHIGVPQQKYKYWMGQVLSDGFLAGQYLAAELVELKKQTVIDKVKMVAISGSGNVAASEILVNGLLTEVEKNPSLKLLQQIEIKWLAEQSKEKTYLLFKRHKHIDAIWSSQTDLALGAAEQIDNMRFEHQEKPAIATIGWSEEVFQAIENEQIAFSLGGNHLNGLWALILIHDIEHGFKLAPTDAVITVPFSKVTKHNISQISPLLTADHWQNKDFKQYSKAYNPKLLQYNFDLSLLLNPAQ